MRLEGNIEHKYTLPILFLSFSLSFVVVLPGSWGEKPSKHVLVASLILELSNRVALAAVSFINCW